MFRKDWEESSLSELRLFPLGHLVIWHPSSNKEGCECGWFQVCFEVEPWTLSTRWNSSVHINSQKSRSQCCTWVPLKAGWASCRCSATKRTSKLHFIPLDQDPPTPPHTNITLRYGRSRRHAFNSLNKQTSTGEEKKTTSQRFYLLVWLWQPPPARPASLFFFLSFFFILWQGPRCLLHKASTSTKTPTSLPPEGAAGLHHSLYISALSKHFGQQLLFTWSLNFLTGTRHKFDVFLHVWWKKTTRTRTLVPPFCCQFSI